MLRRLALTLCLLPALPESATAAPPAPRTLADACPAWASALRKGRAAAAAKRWKEAMAAYGKALDEAPFDEQTLAEYGYAMHRVADPGDDTTVELHLQRARLLLEKRGVAKLTAAQRTLLSVIWWNLSLVHDRALAKLRKQAAPDKDEVLRKEELVRAALAVSASLGSAAARRRLGARSACPAVILPQREEVPPIALATSWKALLKARETAPNHHGWLKLVTGAQVYPPTTEADARRALCTPHDADAVVPLAKACPGPGPWKVTAGYQTTTTWSLHLLQVRPGTFAALEFSTDSRGAVPTRHDVSVKGGVLEAYAEQGDRAWHTPPGQEEEGETGGARCKASLAFSAGGGQVPTWEGRTATRTYYDARTGKTLLTLLLWGSTAVQASISGKVATLSGGGCSGTVPLP